MALLLGAITLLLVVLLLELEHCSLLSATVIFLAAGFVVGEGGLGWRPITPDNPVVARLARQQHHQLFHVIGLVVVAAMMAHFSTDVLVARWVRKAKGNEALPEGERARP